MIRLLDLDQKRININGGAIALGHPLGCTGAKLTSTLLSEMRRRQVRLGMVTMWLGGGLGAAGIYERLERCLAEWQLSDGFFRACRCYHRN